MRSSRPTARHLALLLGALSAATAALGQPLPPPAIRAPEIPAPPQYAPVTPTTPVPNLAPSEPLKPQALSLSASIAGEQRPLRSGLVWRIFEDRGRGSVPELAARLTEANPTASLAPGTYIVHVAYGLASMTRRVTIGSAPVTERLTIAAGALKLAGVIEGVPIAANRLSFSIFVPISNDSEGKLVAANVRSGDLVRLPEGSYHVVSTYGESNAIMRTDLKVERGRVTEATLNHRAATLTLKLVASTGGEAFAGTAFTVLTPGGDVIREAIGAFPTVTLAEGDYVLIARHSGKVYTREFKVESGLDRDVEVMVTAG